jgi:hypothetical protein
VYVEVCVLVLLPYVYMALYISDKQQCRADASGRCVGEALKLDLCCVYAAVGKQKKQRLVLGSGTFDYSRASRAALVQGHAAGRNPCSHCWQGVIDIACQLRWQTGPAEYATLTSALATLSFLMPHSHFSCHTFIPHATLSFLMPHSHFSCHTFIPHATLSFLMPHSHVYNYTQLYCSRLYRPSAYYVAKSIALLPLTALNGLVFALVGKCDLPCGRKE